MGLVLLAVVSATALTIGFEADGKTHMGYISMWVFGAATLGLALMPTSLGEWKIAGETWIVAFVAAQVLLALRRFIR